MKQSKCITFVIGFLFSVSPLFGQSSWELSKSEDDIKIYTRTIEDSPAKEFKAVTTINAKRSDIVKAITNIPDYVNWYPNVSVAKVLKSISHNEDIIYYKIDLPWPASDRDAVLRFNVDSNESNKITKIDMIEELKTIENFDNVVRIKGVKGFWKLTSLGDNKTKIHYQFVGNPGGSLAVWIINMFIIDGPFDTLKALKKKVI